MTIVRIEHAVSNFDGWKKAFDNDPINRKKSGVKRYRIYRLNNQEKLVIIDLEFEHMEQALAMKAALQNMWTKVEGTLIFSPQINILDMVESKEC